MKKSISHKLFGAIFLGFIALIIVFVIALNIYFTNFYEQAKINNLVTSIKQFEEDYKQNKWNSDELFRQMDLFSSTHNVTMTTSEEESDEEEGDENSEEGSEEKNHNEEIDKYVLVTTVDSDYNYYDIFIPSESYNKLSPNQGDKIKLKGYIQEGEVVVPIKINDITIESNLDRSNEIKSIDTSVQIISVKENLTLPDPGERNNFSVLETGEENGVSYIISEIPHTDIRQVEFRKTVEVEGSNNVTFYVLASLQPINETITVLTSFYPYMFVFALLASLVIAFIHSIWVSRPIVKIKNAANKMAKLDFDVKLGITRKDELGELSKSLNSLSESLEKSMGELTIANDKLQKDYDLELQRQKIQKEFVANASHEMKTPLGIIRGYAEGIQDGVKEEEKEDYIEVIVDESRKMDILIQNMLKISKLDVLENQLQKEDVDLEVILFDIIQSFEHMLANNNLLVDISGEFVQAYCDADMIKSAVLNLISNAIKYADKGSIIKISSLKSGNTSRIEIQNKCMPFTEEEKIRIWERFYKIDLSHNTDVEGTGLGLAIVKSVFDTHSMAYGVYNIDDGVVFWFEY